jgi:hypothetical protein
MSWLVCNPSVPLKPQDKTYLLKLPLAEALAPTLIRMLPEQCQAISNCEDMGALLRHI